MIIAIDPGANGGIAWMGKYKMIHQMKLPCEKQDIKNTFKSFKSMVNEEDLLCVVEDVGFHRQGNNAMASVKFGKHVERIETMLFCLDIPQRSVPPKEWQKVVPTSLPKLPRKATKKQRQDHKRDRKNEIKAQMQALYPHLKVTLATADALGILTWALKQGDAI
jgi:hypothetical protein